MNLLDEVKALDLNCSLIVEYYNQNKSKEYLEDWFSEQQIKDLEKIKVVHIEDLDSQAKEAMSDGYGYLPVQLIIQYQGQLFAIDGEYGSYGYDYFKTWYPVVAKEVTKIEYVKITD